MHETFCFWDFDEWKEHLEEAGFKIHQDSKIVTNPWIVEHRWQGKADLFTMKDDQLITQTYPPTTMYLVAIKN